MRKNSPFGYFATEISSIRPSIRPWKFAAVPISLVLAFQGGSLAWAVPSDTLSVSRLEANNGTPTVRNDFRTLELAEGKEDAKEKDSVSIPKTLYYFSETKMINGKPVTGASDFWDFSAFKVTFYSDVLPPTLIDDLKKKDPKLLTTRYEESGSEFKISDFPVLKVTVSSPNPKEGATGESDSFGVTTTTGYSKTQTLTGAQELKFGLGDTIPTQAIEVFDGDKLSDVLVIDPIRYHFESDGENLIPTPTATRFPNTDIFAFDIFNEVLSDRAMFSLTFSSDVPEPRSLLLLGTGMLIARFAFRRRRRPATAA